MGIAPRAIRVMVVGSEACSARVTAIAAAPEWITPPPR
jgi:hypothetical protein